MDASFVIYYMSHAKYYYFTDANKLRLSPVPHLAYGLNFSFVEKDIYILRSLGKWMSVLTVYMHPFNDHCCQVSIVKILQEGPT